MENKYLRINDGVKLTPIIEKPIIKLDSWFQEYLTISHVTSGLRTKEDQFQIIKAQSIVRGIDEEFPDIKYAGLDLVIDFKGEIVPSWLPAWGRLLTIGFIVNPPEEARTPFDYFHPRTGKTIPAGTLIKPSPHTRGTAFDIGGLGGDILTIDDELIVMNAVMESQAIPEIISFLIERKNNAIHVDCREIK